MKTAHFTPRYAALADGPEADFHRLVRARARHYLQTRNDHRFADRGQLLKLSLLGFGMLGSYGLSLLQSTAAGFAICYIVSILCCMLLNINVNHDAAHDALMRSRRTNQLIGRMVTVLLGIEPMYWRERHVVFHHRYPNIERLDLDTEENGVFRQSPYQAWKPHMRYQHWYWPLVASLSLPWIVWVFDWRDRLGKTPLRERGLLPGARGWLVFLGAKAAHFTLALAIPLLLARSHGVSGSIILISYIAAQMLGSLMLVFLLLGTHWAQARFHPYPANGQIADGWYAHNFATACDWRPALRGLQGLMGGLNLHLTHHLFPGWHHRHYDALARIVAQTAAECHLPYRCIGYRELLRAQQDFLRTMGQPRPAA